MFYSSLTERSSVRGVFVCLDGPDCNRILTKENFDMIKEAIVKIVNKGDLTYEEAYAVMNEIMSGESWILSALSASTTIEPSSSVPLRT